LAIRPEFRWVVVTVVVVATLFAIAALAMDRSDVQWRDGEPYCPHCASKVALHSHRCAACREEFEWNVAADEDSPISPWSLSPLEDEWLREHVKSLGHEAAAQRVAQAAGISVEAAQAYLDRVGVGRCGWCGGTGRDPARWKDATAVCPACQGRERCVACGGDRRMRVGDAAAEREWLRLEAQIEDVPPRAPLASQRQELRRLVEPFLARWSGTIQATRVPFWAEFTAIGPSPRVVEVCRRRLDAILDALAEGS
jgi:hypothetical protein